MKRLGKRAEEDTAVAPKTMVYTIMVLIIIIVIFLLVGIFLKKMFAG